MAKSKFLEVVCPICSNKQILYSKASLRVKCANCNILLSKTTGGKTKVRAKVKKVLWK